MFDVEDRIGDYGYLPKIVSRGKNVDTKISANGRDEHGQIIRYMAPYKNQNTLGWNYQTVEYGDINDAEDDQKNFAEDLDLDLDDIADEDDLFNYDEDTSDAVGSQYSGNYLDEYGEEMIRKSEVDATRFSFVANSDPKTETRAAFAKSISDLSEEYSEDTDSNIYDLQNLLKLENIVEFENDQSSVGEVDDYMENIDDETPMFAHAESRMFEIEDVLG